MQECSVKVRNISTKTLYNHEIILFHTPVHADQPTLFLYSPRENLLSNDTYIVEEGRSFLLLCSSSREDVTLMLERVDMRGPIIDRGKWI